MALNKGVKKTSLQGEGTGGGDPAAANPGLEVGRKDKFEPSTVTGWRAGAKHRLWQLILEKTHLCGQIPRTFFPHPLLACTKPAPWNVLYDLMRPNLEMRSTRPRAVPRSQAAG